MTHRPPATPIICLNCGDEIVIVAQYLPTGPLCARCAPPDQPLQIPHITPNDESGRRATASPEDGHPKGNAAQASADAGGDRAASSDPRAFCPPRDALNISIEVEEWIVSETGGVLSSPRDLLFSAGFCVSTGHPTRDLFVVVLEWMRFVDQERPYREIGPSFGHEIRQMALLDATRFARAEARRLKAVGPYGYRPAREIPEVRNATGTKPSVDESAHDPRPSTGAAAQAAEAAGGTPGEAHGA